MAYAAFSVVFGEQPSAAKWNILGTNDAGFNDGTLIPSANADFATVSTQEGRTSSTFGDLATAGPAVTVTIGAVAKAVVIISCTMVPAAANARGQMSFAVSGASTIAAAASSAWIYQAYANGSSHSGTFSKLVDTSLNAGSNTFTAKYASQDNTTNILFSSRDISVIPL